MRSLPRVFVTCLSLFAFILFWHPAHAGELYRWTDEQGNLHLSDTISGVPEKYRSRIEVKKTGDDGPSSDEQPAAPPPRNAAPAEAATEAKPAKKYEVPYKPFENAGRSVKRVIIPVRFNGTVEAPLAIDTGAPDTVISAELAEKLGLFDDDRGTLLIAVGGIGGSTPAVRTIVDSIQVGDAKIRFVPIKIIDKMSDSFEGLLGLDFVSEYSMTINAKRKTVLFEELPVDVEHPGGHDRRWWSDLFREFSSSCADWKAYGEKLDRRIKSSMRSVDNEDMKLKAFADYQYRESEKLLDKLNQYAVQNSVPMHWRTY